MDSIVHTGFSLSAGNCCAPPPDTMKRETRKRPANIRLCMAAPPRLFRRTPKAKGYPGIKAKQLTKVAKPDKSPVSFPAGFHFDDYGLRNADVSSKPRNG